MLFDENSDSIVYILYNIIYHIKAGLNFRGEKENTVGCPVDRGIPTWGYSDGREGWQWRVE